MIFVFDSEMTNPTETHSNGIVSWLRSSNEFHVPRSDDESTQCTRTSRCRCSNGTGTGDSFLCFTTPPFSPVAFPKTFHTFCGELSITVVFPPDSFAAYSTRKSHGYSLLFIPCSNGTPHLQRPQWGAPIRIAIAYYYLGTCCAS